MPMDSIGRFKQGNDMTWFACFINNHSSRYHKMDCSEAIVEVGRPNIKLLQVSRDE